MPLDSPSLNLVIAIAAAFLIAIVVTAIVAGSLRLIGKRAAWPKRLLARARIPFRFTLLIAITWAAVMATLPDESWRAGLNLSFRIGFIASLAWLIGGVAIFLEDLGLSRYRVDVPDNRVARRLRTQVLIIRRLTVVIIVIVALGAILLSFPGVEALGASVLASAGVLSIVAGLAAQSSLANVFAGMQLAFSDAIRVDDVVVVADGEWGRIEEITLTYVVVHVWDDRRLVLPSTWFTSTPFQNWTRRSSELLGAVEFDLDWRVSPDAMRAELDRLVADTPLWDGRTAVLQVTDALGGYVRVRILVTAADAPTLFDLRCYVREGIVAWLNAVSPESLPRERVQVSRAAEEKAPSAKQSPDSGRMPQPPTAPIGLFTGDHVAERRAGVLTGTIQLPTDGVEQYRA